MKTLKDYIKEATADLVFAKRTRLGLAQEDFGVLLGTSQSGVARLESGAHLPSFSTLLTILDCTSKELESKDYGCFSTGNLICYWNRYNMNTNNHVW